MPLLMCPNDNASMQTVNRNGVELDICPTCRGVWLDRGELEKILQSGREDRTHVEQAHQKFEREVDQFHRDPEAWRRSHPYDPNAGRHSYESDYYKYKKKKKGFDLFDIFD